MRSTHQHQPVLGSQIATYKIDTKSRDDIPKILIGLQHIYRTLELRNAIFVVLEKGIAHKKKGRTGMDMWRVFVLSSLRVNLNLDWDRLHNLANEHKTLRAILGHGIDDGDYKYPLQTIKDNVVLLTPEMLIEINQIVVNTGHDMVLKKKRTQRLGHVLIALLLKQTFITPQISTFCGML